MRSWIPVLALLLAGGCGSSNDPAGTPDGTTPAPDGGDAVEDAATDAEMPDGEVATDGEAEPDAAPDSDGDGTTVPSDGGLADADAVADGEASDAATDLDAPSDGTGDEGATGSDVPSDEGATGSDAPSDAAPDEASGTDGDGGGGGDAAFDDIATTEPPELYTSAGGCAEPKDYTTTACDGVSCPEGETCMGAGFCVPEGAFALGAEAGDSRAKPALQVAPDGTFSMAWYVVGGPDDDTWMDVYYQEFAPDATPLGEPVKVDQDALAWARSPTLARLEDGRHLVIWRASAGGTGEVAYYGRRIAEDGDPVGDAFQLNDTALTSESGVATNVDSPFARVLNSRRVAIVWSGQPQGDDASIDVFLRIVDPSGELATGELDVGGADPEVTEASASVLPHADDRLLAIWERGELFDDVPFRIRGVRVGGGGQVLDDPPAVVSSETAPYEGMPSGASFGDGTALITWKRRETPAVTKETRTRAALLDVDAMELLETYDVGFDPEGTYPFYAPAATGPWGRAAVVWHSCTSGEQGGVWLRRYHREPKLLDCEPTRVSQLPPEASGCSRLPAVAAFPDGRFLVAWETDAVEGTSESRIRLRFLR